MIRIIQKLEFALTMIVGAISLLLIIITLIDTYRFFTNSDDYIKVYHLDTSQYLWQFEYLKTSILQLLVSSIALTIIFFSLSNENYSKLLIISRVIVLGSIAAIIIGY